MEETVTLRHKYIAVEKDCKVSYGGSQGWSSFSFIRKSGCGRIAAIDLLLYLGRFHPGCQICDMEKDMTGRNSFAWKEYQRCLKRMGKWFPVIPYLGMPVWFLSFFLNLYFVRYRMPYRAFWGCRPGKMRERIDDMLRSDLPVVLSIGGDFPFFWKRSRLKLYERTQEGWKAAAAARAHFVTITGRQGHMMQISSWGREYYIDWNEYQQYVKEHSSYLISNICCLYMRKRST